MDRLKVGFIYHSEFNQVRKEIEIFEAGDIMSCFGDNVKEYDLVGVTSIHLIKSKNSEFVLFVQHAAQEQLEVDEYKIHIGDMKENDYMWLSEFIARTSQKEGVASV